MSLAIKSFLSRRVCSCDKIELEAKEMSDYQ